MEGALAIAMVFSIPLLAIWTGHRRDVLKMKLQMQQGNPNLTAEVERLRAEVRSLRDTSTQYDMSFDTALQRLERRVDSVENNVIRSRTDEQSVELISGR